MHQGANICAQPALSTSFRIVWQPLINPPILELLKQNAILVLLPSLVARTAAASRPAISEGHCRIESLRLRTPVIPPWKERPNRSFSASHQKSVIALIHSFIPVSCVVGVTPIPIASGEVHSPLLPLRPNQVVVHVLGRRNPRTPSEKGNSFPSAKTPTF